MLYVFLCPTNCIQENYFHVHVWGGKGKGKIISWGVDWFWLCFQKCIYFTTSVAIVALFACPLQTYWSEQKGQTNGCKQGCVGPCMTPGCLGGAMIIFISFIKTSSPSCSAYDLIIQAPNMLFFFNFYEEPRGTSPAAVSWRSLSGSISRALYLLSAEHPPSCGVSAFLFEQCRRLKGDIVWGKENPGGVVKESCAHSHDLYRKPASWLLSPFPQNTEVFQGLLTLS